MHPQLVNVKISVADGGHPASPRTARNRQKLQIGVTRLINVNV